jgi:hypothetical protein
VGLDRQPSRQEVDTMAAGVVIDGTKVRPVEVAVAKVPRHGRAGTTYVAKVVVAEGKKHEVWGWCCWCWCWCCYCWCCCCWPWRMCAELLSMG